MPPKPPKPPRPPPKPPPGNRKNCAWAAVGTRAIPSTAMTRKRDSLLMGSPPDNDRRRGRGDTGRRSCPYYGTAVPVRTRVQMSIVDAELQLGRLGHAVLVPGRLPDDHDLDRGDVGQRPQLALDIAGERAGDRTGRRGQRHADDHLAGRRDQDVVDQAKLVDVDRYLGIEAGAQRRDDAI